MLAAALRVVGGGDAELQSRMQAVQPVVEAHLCGTRVDFGFLLNGSKNKITGMQYGLIDSALFPTRSTSALTVRESAMVEYVQLSMLSRLRD